jgi:hypothetical protein
VGKEKLQTYGSCKKHKKLKRWYEREKVVNLRGGRNKSNLDREDEKKTGQHTRENSNMLERRVRRKGTRWRQSRKEIGWTEQKKRMEAGMKSYMFRDGSLKKKKKRKIKN